MGSSLDSRYWVCPSCCRQFDWQKDSDEIKQHDPVTCRDKPKTKCSKKKGTLNDKN